MSGTDNDAERRHCEEAAARVAIGEGVSWQEIERDIADLIQRERAEARRGAHEEAAREVEKFGEHYHADIFPEASVTKDALAAKMGRHLCSVIPAMIRALAGKPETGEGG